MITVIVTDIGYWARSMSSRSLVHKKIVLKFVKGGRTPLLSLNELDEKSQTTIIHNKFCKQSIIKI